MNEASILMRYITNGTSQPMDAINVSLGKCTGWTRIFSTLNYFVNNRCDTGSAWRYSGIGICNYSSFFNQLILLIVAHFTLDDDKHEYNSENVIKKYPSRGDIFIIKDGKKRFIA